MQELANRIKDPVGISGGLLLGQMLFAMAFVGSCEVPNFMSAAPTTSACLERWMTTTTLFIPSGLSRRATPSSAPAPAPAKPEPLVTPRRTTTRRTTKTTTTAKKS